ncbi:MAG: YdbL family protein [Nitrospirales bacterium]|nr:YdbL family protein [Nitrospira sp.]MDR4501446.1 YdbL family protein [Nitrospirales bacterium]
MKSPSPSSFYTALIMAAMIIGVCISSQGFAATLEDAKAQGYLGETSSGYLGLVTPSAPADVKALMNEVNQKRKVKYEEIAKRNKTSLNAVEALAAKTAISKTQAGHYIQRPDGTWQKK